MSDNYTRVLVLIPVALLGGAAVSLHPAVALHYGLAAGSALATIALYDALYRNPPVPRQDPWMASVTALWHVVLLAGVLYFV